MTIEEFANRFAGSMNLDAPTPVYILLFDNEEVFSCLDYEIMKDTMDYVLDVIYYMVDANKYGTLTPDDIVEVISEMK